MQCTQCGETNLDHAKFCIECGTPFVARCPHCAEENPARAKFCASCGMSLVRQSQVQSSRSTVAEPQLLTPNTQVETEQEAEGHFHKAIDIARQQQAKFLELRATVSLARLWQQQGKRHEAHQMLGA